MKSSLIVLLIASVLAVGQDLERTFSLRKAPTPQAVQEAATVIRATGDIRQMDADAERRSITVRASTDQLALTEWLVGKLDAPAGENGRHQLPPSKDEDRVVAVLHVPHAATPQSLQEIATVVRSIGDIRRVFIYSPPKAMVLRGTPEQIDLAEWLVNELDQPVDSAKPARREYTVPGPGYPDNVVRVFSFKPTITPQRFQEIATQVRVTTQVRRLYTYSTARTIAVRGTPSQVEQAYQMMREADR